MFNIGQALLRGALTSSCPEGNPRWRKKSDRRSMKSCRFYCIILVFERRSVSWFDFPLTPSVTKLWASLALAKETSRTRIQVFFVGVVEAFGYSYGIAGVSFARNAPGAPPITLWLIWSRRRRWEWTSFFLEPGGFLIFSGGFRCFF